MFGNVIYYDSKKISEYRTAIRGKRDIDIKEYEIERDKGMQIDLRALGFDTKASKTYRAEIQESLLLNCNEFEKLLNHREDFFDFTQSYEYDIQTVNRGAIIKLDGCVEIPEEFDIVQTMMKFKPALVNELSNNIANSTEKLALDMLLEMSDTKVPILINFDNQLLCSKLISNNMTIKYEELEEYEELEVTIIAKMISSNVVDAQKPFYDPLKDFMTLNRTLRRSMGERGEGLHAIYADGDYRMIEMLAIYQ